MNAIGIGTKHTSSDVALGANRIIKRVPCPSSSPQILLMAFVVATCFININKNTLDDGGCLPRVQKWMAVCVQKWMAVCVSWLTDNRHGHLCSVAMLERGPWKVASHHVQAA
jgi:hypothetical protein